jgi:hypothetical protein
VGARPWYATRTPRLFPIFPAVFLASSYLSFNYYKVDAAGITAAFSLTYLVMLRRMRSKQGGMVRGAGGRVMGGATALLCTGNVIADGLMFSVFGDRNKEENDRAKAKTGAGWAGDI